MLFDHSHSLIIVYLFIFGPFHAPFMHFPSHQHLSYLKLFLGLTTLLVVYLFNTGRTKRAIILEL